VSEFDPRLENLAEAVAFAHDAEVATLAGDDPDVRALERTAALALAALAHPAALPERLQAKLAAGGLQFCAERAATHRPVVTRREAATSGPHWLTFLAGLAAGVALFLVLTLRGDAPAPASQLRARMLALDAAAVQLPWRAGPSPMSGAVQGEVVWSTARQEGYLTFRGLPPLDAEHRFQLWIVDGTRTGAPVDGGLFAIADATVETVVPVQAKLPIGKPAAFVVTVETQAGAVVSAQEHVVAIAGL
jgi:hypothetical protein